MPGPWPLVAPSRIHGAAALAVHWHSREVVTVTEPDPPAASRMSVPGLMVRAQRCADGAVSVVEPEPHRAAATDAQIAIAMATNEVFLYGNTSYNCTQPACQSKPGMLALIVTHCNTRGYRPRLGCSNDGHWTNKRTRDLDN